jgi:hypothetical protein
MFMTVITPPLDAAYQNVVCDKRSFGTLHQTRTPSLMIVSRCTPVNALYGANGCAFGKVRDDLNFFLKVISHNQNCLDFW